MSQVLTIGGLAMDPDACYFRIHRRGMMGATGRLNRVRNSWSIHGRISGTTASAVDAKVVALENALHAGIDIVFSLGSTMRLISSAMVEGTIIDSFEWLEGYDGVHGSGAEGILRRTFSLVVHGDNLVASDTDLTALSETIQSIGTGGPRVVPVGSLNGAVQAQQTQQITPFYMIQSGHAVGLTSWPAAPNGIYIFASGVFYEPAKVWISETTPSAWGRNVNSQFRTNWSYTAWATFNLGVNPTIVP